MHGYAHVYTKNKPYSRDKDELIITSKVNETEITSGIYGGNILGLQFHPELSGEAWHAIIKRFFEGSYGSLRSS